LDVLLLVLSLVDVELEVLVLSVDDVVDSVVVGVVSVVDVVVGVVSVVDVVVGVVSVVDVVVGAGVGVGVPPVEVAGAAGGDVAAVGLVVDVVGTSVTQVSSAVGFFTLKRRESVFWTVPVVNATL